MTNKIQNFRTPEARGAVDSVFSEKFLENS